MDPLVKKRNLHKGRLLKIQTAVNKHDTDPINQHAVSSYLTDIASIDSKVQDLQEEISQHCTTDAEIDIQADVSDWFQQKVLEVKLKLLAIQESLGGQRPTNQSLVKLPVVTLPTFDGKFENWQSFQDLFLATVENNKTLCGAQKLQYLKSCMTGDAANLIKSFTVTDQNYREAWGLLNDRYDNKREIVHSIIKRLHNQPVVKTESASALQALLDITCECVRSLKVVGRPIDKCDDFLVFLVVEKMDQNSRREFARTMKGIEPSSFKDWSEFMEVHIRGLLASGNSREQPSSSNNQHSRDRKHASSHHSTAEEVCKLCKATHPIFHCPQFKAMSASDRSAEVKSLGFCYNCLRPDHSVRNCTSQSTCKKCGKKHHTLLHFESKASKQPPAEASGSTANVKLSHVVQESHESSDVLLKTALVKVRDSSGGEKICRVLLDDGSQASFITEACANSLGLKRKKVHITINGISSSSSSSKGQVDVQLESLVHQATVGVQAFVLPKVTGTLPKLPCDLSTWSHINGLQLADPDFHKPGPIDILIGSDVAPFLLREGIRTGPRYAPVAQNSLFGWVLSGPIKTCKQQVIRTHHANCDLDQVLHKFWELEELPATRHLTPEHQACEKHFAETHTRNAEGRYVVKLPFNSNIQNLGKSRDQAIIRLKQLERRLAKHPNYRQEYNEFMRQYLELNHMQKVPAAKFNETIKCFYMPHHYVLTASKFRVVFDASMKSSTGLSLNDCLLAGPTIQDDLFTTLVRFRCHAVALKGDFKKMYRQFRVHDDDVDFQRIVWRESPEDPIQEYQLTTVTYGTKSAPFLATRCLQQLAHDEGKDLPLAAKALKEETYVDDLLGGGVSSALVIKLKDELIEAGCRSGMELVKLASNDPEVLKTIPIESQETATSLDLDLDNSIKALGVQWHPASDEFRFSTKKVSNPQKIITKRELLSELAKVFDPLGWLAPTTLLAKLMLQDLWKLKCDWDEVAGHDLQSRWTGYQNQLPNIEQIKIPRCILSNKMVQQQLHGFCDASEKAYAAAVYVRCTLSDGSVIINLVAAKTRVAPIKQVSLPRLELCGALLLCELIKALYEAMNLKCSVTAWSDSTVVLDWLRDFPGRWHTFVANRVAKIQEVVPSSQWRHVRSEDNPADCASRGLSAEELRHFSMWWKGPLWLQRSSDEVFPYSPDINSILAEAKPEKIVVAHASVDIFSLMSKYSSLTKLKRITAYWIRFINNCKPGAMRASGPLTPHELESALHSLIRIVQRDEFVEEIKGLRAPAPSIPSRSQLKQLCPFLDQQGIVRVSGRITNANIPESHKHQVILPHNHVLTTLIIRDCHLRNLHGGFQLTHSTLQQEYWILRGRDTVRHLIRKCVICRKRRAETAQQLMGSLPSARVNPGRPFAECGVDFAGPYNIKPCKGRGHKTFKCYFAIFVCLTTKAVHLEAVTDLSTEGFIASLKRLVSRRGVCRNLYSDCGTNFTGADKELKTMFESSQTNDLIAQQLADQGIKWNFNPPSAPHQGGLWEAGVKSVKYHLRRVVGQTNLSLEEFQTLLCLVEACLNSRPLCAMSSDPADFTVLTPGHFLIGSPLNAIPEPDLTPLNTNRLSRWQTTQQLFQHLWKRWQAEYLSEQQRRFKWVQKRANLEVGDLVLIKDELLPPLKWKFGRVILTHPGKDGCVRVVTVKTQSSEFKRPIAKLCPILSAKEDESL